MFYRLDIVMRRLVLCDVSRNTKIAKFHFNFWVFLLKKNMGLIREIGSLKWVCF